MALVCRRWTTFETDVDDENATAISRCPGPKVRRLFPGAEWIRTFSSARLRPLTSREQVALQGIGKPVRRREDARLPTGGGHFADMNLQGQAYAYMVRSPHAHAPIACARRGSAVGHEASSRRHG